MRKATENIIKKPNKSELGLTSNKKITARKAVKIMAFKQPIMATTVNVTLKLNCTLAEINDLIQNDILWNSGNVQYNPSVKDYVAHDTTTKMAYGIFKPDLPKEVVTPVITEKKTELFDENKIINAKLRDLKLQLYNNTAKLKVDHCFWCTCEIENDDVHSILQYVSQPDGDTHISKYGSFCSPECAVAHLYNLMPWDDFAKNEAYQIMNRHYRDTNDTAGIRPAISPHFVLDKFQGNLTHSEYKQLNKLTNHPLLLINKPTTRVLPELHDDREISEHSLSTSIGMSGFGKYKVRKQSEKKLQKSATEILREQFGLTKQQ